VSFREVRRAIPTLLDLSQTSAHPTRAYLLVIDRAGGPDLNEQQTRVPYISILRCEFLKP